MNDTITRSTTGTRRASLHRLTFAVLCAALLCVVAVSSAGASKAKVIGKTRHTPSPACPTNCTAVGRVTGFQLVADGEKRPFNVHRNGKIVAWAIDLSRPGKSDRNFFENLFKTDKYGSKATARIAVIRHKDHDNYRLLRQSPVVKLNSAFGSREVITLDKPLRVRKGTIVALTYPTWAPNFANSVSAHGNRWRASRVKGRCNTDSQHLGNVRKSRPHQKVGSTRHYTCDYRAARLLYWAYFVPS